MDIWVCSSMELLQTQLLEPLLSMSRGVHVEFLSNRVYVWLALVEVPNYSAERLYHFSLPPVLYEGPFTTHLCQCSWWLFLLILAILDSVLYNVLQFALEFLYVTDYQWVRLCFRVLIRQIVIPFHELSAGDLGIFLYLVAYYCLWNTF